MHRVNATVQGFRDHKSYQNYKAVIIPIDILINEYNKHVNRLNK